MEAARVLLSTLSVTILGSTRVWAASLSPDEEPFTETANPRGREAPSVRRNARGTVTRNVWSG